MRLSEVFAARVKDVRKRKNWSQRELADRLGEVGSDLSRATLANIETADATRSQNVTLNDAVEIAWALDVPLVTLLTPKTLADPVQPVLTETVGGDELRHWVSGVVGIDQLEHEERAAVDQAEGAWRDVPRNMREVAWYALGVHTPADGQSTVYDRVGLGRLMTLAQRELEDLEHTARERGEEP